MEIEYNQHAPEDTAHIISMVLMSRPAHQQQIENAVNDLSGCEVHTSDAKGRIVVVIEADTNRALVQRMETVQGIDHLVSSSLVFHQIA